MMTTRLPWDLYRSFLAVARHGSLSAAARALSVTQPTIGRHLDQLELTFGIPLFTRSPQGLIGTATALTLVPIAEAMESAAEAITRAASADAAENAGTVRITASEIMGAEVLPGILVELAEKFPKLVFELNLSNRPEDLLRRDADIAVRMVRPIQTGLVARRIGETVIGLYAHRRYLAAHPPPPSLSALAGARMIGFDRNPVPLQALADAGLSPAAKIFSLRTDSDLAQLAALRAGYGIGGCQIGIARRDPDLVRVLADEFAIKLETWLVMHEDLRTSIPVRRTFDHLATGLADYLATSRLPNRNGIIPDDTGLDAENLPHIRMPNRDGSIDRDDWRDPPQP
jgi:DNA-binding transcriptional LysR family regulator